MQVSEPQRLTMPENFVRGFAHWVANKGVDPHEFAKSYVDRTVQLGYAPDLKQAAQEFVSERIGG
jgi:hypothetical protein